MDLWDVAKVMWRRRWVALPLLLLSMVAAVFALMTVPPDYQVTGQVAVTPPAAQDDPVGGPVRPKNPYTVVSLGQLTSLYLNRPEAKRQLASEGLSPSYEMTMETFNLALVEIKVTAKSVPQATQTLARLIELLRDEFRHRQDAFNLAPEKRINPEVLNAGEEIVVVRTVGKRTLIVIVGVGILITVAVSLWVDALVRRRQAKGAATQPARFAVPMPPAPSSPAPAGHHGPFPPRPPSNLNFPNAANAATVEVEGEEDNDSTIVLPLAGVAWTTAKGKRAQAPGEKPSE
jgi:subunit length determinant Wzz-like protein